MSTLINQKAFHFVCTVIAISSDKCLKMSTFLPVHISTHFTCNTETTVFGMNKKHFFRHLLLQLNTQASVSFLDK